LESALSQFRVILDKAPSFHQARLAASIILLRQKRIDDAISEIDKLLAEDGKNALAHNVRGSAYLAKGMYDEGIKDLNRAIELNPRIVDAHLKKGLFHLSRGKSGEFETDLKTAVQVAPEMLNTRLILASYYMSRNNHGKALTVLSEGLTGAKRDADLYTYMAKIMFADKKPDQGVQCLQKAKASDPGSLFPYFSLAAYYASNGNDEKVMNECAAVLQRDPGNVRATLCVAETSERQGRDGEALAYYLKATEKKTPAAYLLLANYYVKKKDDRKALSVLEDSAKSVPPTTAILEMKGRLQMKDKRYKEALKTFGDIEAIAPERGLPLKIAAYLDMNKPTEALREADRVITLKPNSAYGYMLLAGIYRRQNKPDRAVEELKKGLALDSSDSNARLMLAEMYARAGNHSQAIRECEIVTRIHPNFANAYFTCGVILEQAGNKKEALKNYLHALTIARDFVPALNNLAILYADGYGSKAEALRLAEAALELKPENPRVIDTLGYALLKNGRLQDARRTLEKAAALLPDNPTVKFHLALVYKALGDKEGAVAMLQKALSAGEFMERSQAGTLLGELD
jgi:tetratricopeptide (TPR) repeat protein